MEGLRKPLSKRANSILSTTHRRVQRNGAMYVQYPNNLSKLLFRVF